MLRFHFKFYEQKKKQHFSHMESTLGKSFHRQQQDKDSSLSGQRMSRSACKVHTKKERKGGEVEVLQKKNL